MLESVCPLCGEAVLSPLLKLHIQLEKNLIREMREENPDMFSSDKKDGVCDQCIEAYKRKHERVRAEAREIRARVGAGDGRVSFNGDGDAEDESY